MLVKESLIEDDHLIIDDETTELVNNLSSKYPGSQIVIDKRMDRDGEYLYLTGLIIKKKYRGSGLATKIIGDILQYADENNYRVKAWASDVFGVDINIWVSFLVKMGFKKIDEENNLIYYPSN